MGGNDYQLHVWDGGRPSLPFRTFHGHSDDVTSLLWLEENRLVSSSKDGTVRLHRVYPTKDGDDGGAVGCGSGDNVRGGGDTGHGSAGDGTSGATVGAREGSNSSSAGGAGAGGSSGGGRQRRQGFEKPHQRLSVRLHQHIAVVYRSAYTPAADPNVCYSTDSEMVEAWLKSRYETMRAYA